MITAAGIRKLLPHRYPMLLVDRVLDAVPGERITAIKAITLNEPWYSRMAPDAPDEQFAYPASLLIESWGQTAGILGSLDNPNPDVLSGKVMLLGAVSAVEFDRKVFPGDVLEHRVRVSRALPDTVIFEGECVVGEETVFTIERMVMAFRPAEQLRPAEPELPASV